MTDKDYLETVTSMIKLIGGSNMREMCLEIDELREEYIKDNARFKIGDYIGNVTGMIKVEQIFVQHKGIHGVYLQYMGLRYKSRDGIFLRTKEKKPTIFDDCPYSKLKKRESKKMIRNRKIKTLL